MEPLDQQRWRYHLGLGVSAAIDGHAVLVGSARFLQAQGVVVDDRAGARQAATIIYVAVDGDLGGTIVCEDPIRPEAPGVLEAVRHAGVRYTMLLTGDSYGAADAVARQLGIDQVVAESFPEQKAAIVRELHDRGYRVAFVGDGINDSPALAYADVSVSLRHGADVARETADIVLMERGIAALPEAIQICRDGLRTIRQSIGIVAVPNALALGLAAAGLLSPVAATVLNNGSAIVAGLHALHPLRRLKRGPAAATSAA
jgi:Cu2+-exporting ATPase